MPMQNVTAELVSFSEQARGEFTASFGAQYTDHEDGVTLFAGALDPAWVPILRYALLGVVGEAGLVSFVATDMV